VDTTYAYTSAKISPAFYTRPVGIVSFTIARKSTGILSRMCIPILLIMLLSAMSYWGTVNDRIATTVTALLAIAALYIGIVGSIPLVGYMTRLDDFMLIMFAIVFTNTAMHMTVVRLNVQEKGTNWPLRKLAVRVIEFFGRLTMTPWIILTYIYCFFPALSLVTVVLVSLVMLGFEWVLLQRYLPELHATTVSTIRHIELKQKLVARSSKVTISSLELRFLRYVRPWFRASLEAAEKGATAGRSAGSMEAGRSGGGGGGGGGGNGGRGGSGNSGADGGGVMMVEMRSVANGDSGGSGIGESDDRTPLPSGSVEERAYSIVGVQNPLSANIKE
jgi:hypothetical protein